MNRSSGFRDKFNQRLFNALLGRSLVYNACWEDPAVDRKALNIRPNDRMLVITSAGCNVLDYALLGPEKIFAVDANPRQTALLELKLAGIRHLDHEDFFAIFGAGRHQRFRDIYHDALRPALGEFARDYWDAHEHWFDSSANGGFYLHGLAGQVARGFRGYLGMRRALREAIEALMQSRSLDQQRAIYDRDVEPYLWKHGLNWLLSLQATMTLLGVPQAQRREVQREHGEGVAGYVRDAVRYVFRSLPLHSNYFWMLYLRGHYTPGCCPEYLTPSGFAALKEGRADCVEPHTLSVTEFLEKDHHGLTKLVLLDHMDWMAAGQPGALEAEWHAIFASSAPAARVIFRSAHHRPDYLERVRVRGRRLRDALEFHDGLAMALAPMDRVHTYAGFHIADLPA